MVLAACLVLAAGYQFWLRDSPLVAVEDVKVTGLTTKDAARVRAALVSAAHTMTTLHVDQARARATRSPPTRWCGRSTWRPTSRTASTST